MLKALLDSLDGLDDSVQKFYEPGQGDLAGKFVLKVEGVAGYRLENVDGLSSTLGKLKDENAAQKTALEAFKGLDAKKVRESLADLERLRAINPESQADKLAEEKVAAATKKLTEQHGVEIAERDETNKALTAEVERLLIVNEAKTAIAKHKGIEKLLLPAIRPRLRVKKGESGEFEVEVLNEQGNQEWVTKGGKAVAATIDDLVAKLKEDTDYGAAFEGTGHSGSGARNQRGGSFNGKNPWAKGSENTTEQMRLLKTNPTLAASLKAQAGVAA